MFVFLCIALVVCKILNVGTYGQNIKFTIFTKSYNAVHALFGLPNPAKIKTKCRFFEALKKLFLFCFLKS